MSADPNTYDELPYECNPSYPTHPDCLATIARLSGLRTPDVDGCHVLELGCGTGGNLIPMAQGLPDSQFVGIDLSPRQIEMGAAVVRELGLTNIKLLPLSILDVDERFESFDYIICHGVYSWAPRAVQEKILSICRTNLGPFGVAYVSYNTYPGWHLRRIVREAMGFHVRGVRDPAVKVRAARAFVDFLAEKATGPDDAYVQFIKQMAAELRDENDTYVFHEYLESDNEPVYFREFAARAAAQGLQYVGESYWGSQGESLDDDTREVMLKSSRDIIEYEQYSDLLRGRTFRRTVLCHEGVALDRLNGAAAVAEMQIIGIARPNAAPEELAAQIVSNDELSFVGPRGESLSTNHPVVKAALCTLHERWPAPIGFAELCQLVVDRLGVAEQPGVNVGPALAEALVRIYQRRLIELHLRPFSYSIRPGERPTASPLARLQVHDTMRVVTLRHSMANLSPLEAAVLPLLDGTRDRAALLEALQVKVREGALGMEKDGQPVKDPALARDALSAALEPCLNRLALNALIV